MKTLYRLGVVLALFLAALLLSAEIYVKCNTAAECSTLCGCGSDRGCNCFVATDGKCRCSDCNCEKGLTPLTEDEFKKLQDDLKKEIARRKKAVK